MLEIAYRGTSLRMKENLLVFLLALLCGGALSLMALNIVVYQFGGLPSLSEMGHAAVLGAALGGAVVLI